MRKPIKPFAVETRRAGRKPMGNPITNATPSLSSTISRMALEDEAPRSAPEWPSFQDSPDEDNYGAAMRAADALFSRPVPEPDMSEGRDVPPETVVSEPPRRILQSLNEDDHIERLLAAAEVDRPKRGRRPRAPQDEPTQPALRLPDTRDVVIAAPDPVPVPAEKTPAGPILGYVRGEIFARYARHTEARHGEQWRKKSVKPRW
jgi:hypothetical protein